MISGLTGKGFRVGSIKHIHHPDFRMDREGTNTWRHARAGSRIVVALARTEIAVILKDNPEEMLDPVLDFMKAQGIDVVVVEGLHSSLGRRPEVLKIVAAHDSEDLRQRLHDTAPPVLAVSGIIANKETRLPGMDMPIVDPKTDCPKLVELVIEALVRT